MEKLKKYIFNRYFVVFLIILILSFTIAIIVTKNNRSGYILVSNIEAIKCKKNKCQRKELESLIDLNLENFNLYNPNYLGEYKGTYNTKWNFFDLNGNWTDILDGFVAGSKTLNLKMSEYNSRNLSSEELNDINNLLKKEKNISKYTELEQTVIDYNFNSNQDLEKLIIISNATLDSTDDILFSAVIGYINHKYEILEFESAKNAEFYLLPAYRLKGIINIFNNKKDYILLIKGYYSEEKEPSLLLYEATNRHFKNILN